MRRKKDIRRLHEARHLLNRFSFLEMLTLLYVSSQYDSSLFKPQKPSEWTPLSTDPNTDPEVVLRDAQRVIRSRHQILHTTIQVERYEPLLMDNCHQCQPLT